MQRRLKERLIGAAVLVMLAVIFIPMILNDTSQTETRITKSNIPAKPDTKFSSRMVPLGDATGPDTQETPAAQPPAETQQKPDTRPSAATQKTPQAQVAPSAPAAPALGPETGRSTDKQTAKETPKTKPASAREDIGVTAWVVQLGSFSNETNANNLNDELHKAGFASFVEPLKQEGNVVYRVRVGPELLRSNAKKLKERLHEKLKLDGIILAYP